MKFIGLVLVVLIALLQYRLWFGDGSVSEITRYQNQLDEVQQEVKNNKERNQALYAEVQDLRGGVEATEERARHELGMIKEHEVFFQVVEQP